MTALVQVQGGLSFRERLKDAAVIAVVALLLGIPMIGLTTADRGGALQVLTRWPALATFVAVCFSGRLV